jgi:beta-glucosidase
MNRIRSFSTRALNRLAKVFLLAFAWGIGLQPAARANEESCLSCDQPVEVTGQFSHYKAEGGPAVQGVKPGDDDAFHEEIFGPEFSVSVPHLPAGKYTVVIGEAETYFTQTNQRRFTISIGHQTVATNWDIVAAAGGPDKAVYLSATVDHADDSLRGPLTVTFTSDTNNAKFNTLAIQDAAGATLIETRAADLADPLMAAASRPPTVSGPEIWKDPAQPMDARVNDLIRRLSLAEKVQQLRNAAPAIPRLGVPAYDYWNEALHGVARNGIATVFPQAIGMAATWDTNLIHDEGGVIATEGRAKFNEFTRTHHGDSRIYTGLTFWSPNLNIFRDPRWGRGQETYGEDPFLTGDIGVSFIRGVQGDNPKYYEAVACAKHFAVHSGPEPLRHRFNVDPSQRDLYETYLPQFEMAVRDARVGGVMGAYNSLFGTPACASPFLLTDILRGQWGFRGYIVSDCGAINDISANHHFTRTPEAGAAAALKAGCDICCGSDYNTLLKALEEGLVTASNLDTALSYALKTRFKLGLFDPPGDVPFSRIPISANDSPAHQALALKAAEESIVLLKNNGVLPLRRDRIKRIAVVGANADSEPVLLGNYNGQPSHPITILDGIQQAAGPGIEVTYTAGGPLVVRTDGQNRPDRKMLDDAIAAAKAADVVIYVGGISPELEGEEFGGKDLYPGFDKGDRTRIELPAVQQHLLESLKTTGRPVIFVNCSGSAIAMPWAAKHLPAIVQAWYPGEAGGRAVADVLFGDVNPAGRLPVTFYRSTRDLPGFEDYSMANRTYRYFSGRPLFAFGHGLSYTKFSYRRGHLSQSTVATNGVIELSFNLKNVGGRDGDEVAQIYFRHVHSAVPQPRLALCAFQRVHLKSQQSTEMTFRIPVERFRYWDVAGKHYTVELGKYELLIAAGSDDVRQRVPLKVCPD